MLNYFFFNMWKNIGKEKKGKKKAYEVWKENLSKGKKCYQGM